MKSILEQLYIGKITPEEDIIPEDPQYRMISGQVSNMMEMWKKKLSPEDFELLEQMLDLKVELHAMQNKACFVQGYKLGAKMTAEALS
ncbi:hypothetical protein J2Z32_004417 [Paenibacillus turicensis]|uniref:Transcriptional regulator n=1 Tax=Paenibacillus turicensis TaxID=160487 RepID=A0ABS4FYT4_9BACL|nr:DUF6809 family protein [Paenibacillus turicensis]MBP1907736.1 hypothetical protein [Paenibacillus turicensis]